MMLFDGETTNTTSSVQAASGGLRTIYCWGTFGGATVTVETSPDGTEWFTHTDHTFTEKGVINIVTANGQAVRGQIAGGTGHTIYLSVV